MAVFIDKPAAEQVVAPDQVDDFAEPALTLRVTEAAGLHTERRRGADVQRI